MGMNPWMFSENEMLQAQAATVAHLPVLIRVGSQDRPGEIG